jgi:hypothetical protein
MSTLQQAPAVEETAAATKFTFTHDADATEIFFFPKRPGPIIVGQPSTGPELTYNGPEGSFTFFSDKIDIQSGPLGSLISVILGPIEIFGGTKHFLSFSLLLPQVNMGTQRKSHSIPMGLRPRPRPAEAPMARSLNIASYRLRVWPR